MWKSMTVTNELRGRSPIISGKLPEFPHDSTVICAIDTYGQRSLLPARAQTMIRFNFEGSRISLRSDSRALCAALFREPKQFSETMRRRFGLSSTTWIRD